MSVIANNVLPLFLIFLLGHLCKRFGLLTRENADLLLKLFFYVALPALVLLSIPQLELTLELLSLPIAAMAMVLSGFLLALFWRRRLTMERQALGVFFVGSIIFNGAFAYPFIFVSYGEQGMAIAYLFDFGNAVVAFSLAYYLACRYGSSDYTPGNLVRKFVLSPPLLALLIAIVLNLTGLRFPSFGQEFLRILSSLTTPLVLLALGVYFNPRIVHGGPLVAVIVIRIFCGMLLGLLLVKLFGLTGMVRNVVLVMAVSPSGMNTLTYAAMEGLDKEFAASLISYTTVISMLMFPLMIYLTG
ncbi:MAG: hypothetical protein C0622_07900 [Desulfuromonas sp.]|nr:MAG: hypothetical protein C0622_07900 [Desulfuromonas sp.]